MSASPFAEAADMLDDLAVIFTARRDTGGTLSASQVVNIEDALKGIATLVRIGERQRIALLGMLARPVAEDGVTVVLAPFTALPGGRA